MPMLCGPCAAPAIADAASESSAEGFLRAYRNVLSGPLATRAGSILCIAHALTPATSNETAASIFDTHPGLLVLPVVGDGRPLGLLNRQYFVTMLSRRYYRELYGQRSCTTFMDESPLVVDMSTPVVELLDLIVATGDKAISDGFVIVDAGQYAGIGLARDVLRVVASAQAAYARSLAQARSAVDDQEARAEALVAERTRQLEIARAEALRAARLKGEFLAHMSHEIRTPLNGVLGLAHIGLETTADERAAATFKRIVQSGRLLLGIVNDILDFSRIDAGKLAIEVQRIALADLLDGCIGNHAEAARSKGLVLALSKTVDLPAHCRLDPLRLEQILTNLLANAIKFTEAGRVTLIVERSGNRLRLAVEDTGVGMSAEQAARVFEPFEQADNSTTRRFGGTGLGLTITRRLVELMGGEIAVTSAPGRGSRFDVVLPLVDADGTAPAPAVETPSAIYAARLNGVRILVAEDNEVNRIVIEGMLCLAGATVTLAVDGGEAIAAVASASPDAFDLVLMDLQMPGMNGYEATRRIRERAPGLPIVALTAHVLAEERERCRQAGMVDVVTKPIDAGHLAEVIRRYCRKVRPEPAGAGREGAPPASGAPLRPAVMLNRDALAAAYGGKPGLPDRICASFVSSYAGAPGDLRSAAGRDDLPAIAEIAHRLRSGLGFLQATAAAELAARTEIAARAKDREAIALSTRLADDIAQLCAEIGVSGDVTGNVGGDQG